MGAEFYNAISRLTGGFSNQPTVEAKVDLAKQMKRLAAIEGKELKLFATEMQRTVNQLHPAIAKLFNANAQAILDGMRTCAAESKGGYQGSSGSGSALSYTLSWGGDFIDPDSVGTNFRRTWTRVVTAVSAVGTPTPFITGTVVAVGTAVNLAMAEEESTVWLGMTERADVNPIATAMQLVYNADTYNYSNMPFNMLSENEQNLLVYEMPQPLVVPPEQSMQINVRYDDTGISYLTPIVVRFRRAQDMRAL